MQIQTNHFDLFKSGAPSIAPASLDAIKPNADNRVDSLTRVEQLDQFQALSQAESTREGVLASGISEAALAVDLLSPTPEQLASRLGAKLQYDQHTQASEGAVAQYLTNQHAAEREAIQLMVGIDTYA
ncbi:hypothetical protein [Shewanella violacea]|uniref:Uncharacterized protein n=1 Tax=Shewanella violacea (strain JCM 10179 / CIP 106290 / LMG 19151 / DSS12) TaxID=637905 RepID=D4ZL97_SHEVD|nr:hypothetical protein [Shewanella violacea]BAJ02446.1 conserved hypothetical protein [Shewanella violacea DSS12]